MFGYNAYGERISDSLSVYGDTHLIAETQDAMGRSTGFSYSKNGSLQHTVPLGYGTGGRINCAGFVHGGKEDLISQETNISPELSDDIVSLFSRL